MLKSISDVFSESNILARTYLDTMTVFHPVKKVVDGETVFLTNDNGAKVHENVPCSLSSKSTSKLVKDIALDKVMSDYTIFAKSDVIVKSGDYIVLTRNIGQSELTYYLKASKPKLYETHQEIPVNEVEKV